LLLFNKISDLYTASSVKRLPNDEAFDILLFNELGAEVKKMMPPHRRGFLTIIFMSLAAMERTPESEAKSLVYAVITILILTAIMFRTIFTKKAKKEATIDETTISPSIEALKGNIVGRAEDGTEYYLIKMKGNTVVNA